MTTQSSRNTLVRKAGLMRRHHNSNMAVEAMEVAVVEDTVVVEVTTGISVVMILEIKVVTEVEIMLTTCE